MKKIRTLIVDDEPLARKRISNLLRGRAEFEIVGECSHGKQAIQFIQNRTPALVFLDVQMPDLDGFGVLKAIAPLQMPLIIFVTAFDQYALQAFEVHALDYLLKPFDDERFEKSLEWAMDQFRRDKFNELNERLLALLEDYNEGRESRLPAMRSPKHAYPDRLVIKSSGRVFFLKTEAIDWIEAEGYYVRLHVGSKSHLMRETMTRLEVKLDPARFLRIHRSTVVNVERVKELKQHSHGECIVILQNDTPLKLSRHYREGLQRLLGR